VAPLFAVIVFAIEPEPEEREKEHISSTLTLRLSVTAAGSVAAKTLPEMKTRGVIKPHNKIFRNLLLHLFIIKRYFDYSKPLT
jgi:hypothetical protein